MHMGHTPQGMGLRQNRPNPFNDGTTVEFALMHAAASPISLGVSLEVYDPLGQRVRTLFEGRLIAGIRCAFWDGRNTAGTAVASGRYVYLMTAGQRKLSRTMTLIR